MKNSSTVAIEGIEIFKPNQLTIGLDLGDRTCHICVLNEAGEIILEQEQWLGHQKDSSRCSGTSAEPDRAGNRNAFALGQPAVDRARARRDRGACAQRATDHREQPERRRSAGCPDASTFGANRSQLAWSGAHRTAQGPDPSDGDPGAGGAGQRAYGAGECGPRAHEILRYTASEMRRRTDESRDYQKSQAGSCGKL